MKKTICLLTILASLFSVAFSKNFFTQRFFELQMGVPVDFSNNAINLNDFFQKEICIDLKKLSDEMPNEGLDLVLKTSPYFALNFNIAAFSIGNSTGFDIYEKMNVSKDLFDFLGKGNEIGEEQNISLNNYTDIFIYDELRVGINFGRFSIEAKPAIYLPLASASGTVANLSFKNDDDGNINIGVKTDITLNTNFTTDSSDSLMNDLFSGMGFDLGGKFSIPAPFLRNSKLTATARIPIVPGRYKYQMRTSYETEYDMQLPDSPSPEQKEGTGELNEPQFSELFECVYVNRPLKMNAYIDYMPIAGLINFCGGLGVGIYHPFVENTFWYPEYYFSAGINLIDILKAKVSTEYTDQIFKHQFSFDVNIRLMEIECGVSVQSTNLLKSFNINGLGAYAVVSIGI